MKLHAKVLGAIVLALFLASAPAQAGIGFRVTGAFDRVLYGDYNDFVKSLNEVLLPELDVTGTLSEIHWLPEVGGEVLLSYLPRTTIGVGFGYVSGSSSFSLAYSDVPFDFKHTVKAYPIDVTAYVAVPVPLAFVKPYVIGGIGIYPGRITFDETAPVDTLTYRSSLSKTGFGLRGGVGFEAALSPMISVDLECVGRWAKLRGFEGTETFASGASRDVFLARYEERGRTAFGPKSIEDKGAYGEGAVDLSGVCFALGVKVMF